MRPLAGVTRAGLVLCSLIVGCGDETGTRGAGATEEGARGVMVAAVADAIVDPVAGVDACLAAYFAAFTDAEIADHIENNNRDDIRNAAGAAREGCSVSGTVPADTVPSLGEPELDAFRQDPVGWLQTKFDLHNRALCGNEPELLDQVWAASPALDDLKAEAGTTCPQVAVASVNFEVTDWQDPEIVFQITLANGNVSTQYLVNDGTGWKLKWG